MAGKSSKRIRTAPLLTCRTVPLTDPAEIAKLEAMTKRYNEAERLAEAYKAAWMSKRSTAAELWQLVGQLSAPSRMQLLTELAAQLSTQEQSQLVKQLLAQLPADARQNLRAGADSAIS
jgi:hypothetical protein